MDVTLIIFVAAVALGIWFFTKGFGE